MEFAVRLLQPEDSLSELTELLHRAYAALAAMDLKFVATWQDEEITRQRVESGECWVALCSERKGDEDVSDSSSRAPQNDGEARRLVGTVMLRPPESTSGCPWYDRPSVASFGQFAVEPELQCCGIGAALLNKVEERARELGAEELALDTAEPASHLIEYYGRKGYRLVGEADWRPTTNYKSVIMSKRL